MVEQGRYPKAEALARDVIDIYETLGFREDAQTFGGALAQYASVLSLERKYGEAAGVYARLEAAVKNWDPARVAGLRIDATRILRNTQSAMSKLGWRLPAI